MSLRVSSQSETPAHSTPVGEPSRSSSTASNVTSKRVNFLGTTVSEAFVNRSTASPEHWLPEPSAYDDTVMPSVASQSALRRTATRSSFFSTFLNWLERMSVAAWFPLASFASTRTHAGLKEPYFTDTRMAPSSGAFSPQAASSTTHPNRQSRYMAPQFTCRPFSPETSRLMT
ncbi:hypothetical protein COEX109129_39925 [Corallococcus exiguus]